MTIDQALAERRAYRRQGQEALREALKGLSGTERREAFRVCLDNRVTLEELAQLTGISKQRVHQIVNG